MLASEMEAELCRVSTFSNWPETASISALLLAKSGFFYSGESDEVVCFACKTRLDGWSANDSPRERHERSSPNCHFLKKDVTGNVPLKIRHPDVNLTMRDKGIGLTVTDNAELEYDRVQHSEVQPDLNQLYYNVYYRAKGRGLLWNDSDYQMPDFDALRSEEARLRTFFNWPPASAMRPESLASAGLFYTGSEDRVQCAFCHGFLYNWMPNDSPVTEHKKHRPDCLFVHQAEVGNIPMVKISAAAENGIDSENVKQNPMQNGASSPVSRNRLVCESMVQTLAFPVSPESPMYPEYSEIGRRIQSFRRGKVSPGQTAEDLAEAGWFFIGPGDKVNCFQCGGNLKDWEPHDDPWQEHRKWYPHCPFVTTHEQRPRSQMLNRLIPQNSGRQFHVEPREITARMDTPTSLAILDMGFSKDLVRMAIENRLTTKGDDFPNVESLLEALFQLEESGSQARKPRSGMYQNTAAATLSTNDTGSNSVSTSQGSISNHRSDFSSLPASKASSSTASLATMQSLASTPSEKHATSATPALSAVILQLVAEGTSKSNGKKNWNEKKPEATATEKDEQPAETQSKPLKNQGKTEGDPNPEEIEDEEAMKYLEENRQMREARTCKVCMDSEVNTVFLPCGHLVCCNNCSPHLKNCPMCRTYIRGTVKTFLS